MEAVDGNAIGGLLIDVFGTEMTAASSTCAVCGARRRAPGTVVRCRTCGSVLMVLVRRTNVTSVDLSGLADLGQPGSGLYSGGRDSGRACTLNEHTDKELEKEGHLHGRGSPLPPGTRGAELGL